MTNADSPLLYARVRLGAKKFLKAPACCKCLSKFSSLLYRGCLVLLFIIYHYHHSLTGLYFQENTTAATYEAGSVYPSETHAITSLFDGVRVDLSFVFYVVICVLLFFCLCLFFFFRHGVDILL